MRIAKFVSSLPRRGRADAPGFQFSASAIAVIILLSVHSVAAFSSTSRPTSESEISPSDSAVRPDLTDCSAGGLIPRGKFNEKGVEEGIREAIKILETCRGCRKFFGKVNPISRLKKLRKRGAIIVSNKHHTGFEQVGLNKFAPTEPEVMPGSMIAFIIDLTPSEDTLEFISPCIYVNPSRFLVDDASFALEDKKSPFYGLTLAKARGLAILHELAHIAAAIPLDGVRKGGEFEIVVDRSEENTRCVLVNCIPCASRPLACSTHSPPQPSQRRRRPFKPKRHSSILRKFGSGRVVRLGLGS